MTLIYTFLLCCLSVFVQCQETPTTLLFIDKSPSALKHYGDNLDDLVLDVLKQEIADDSHDLVISFIYEGTESLLNRKLFSYQIDEKPDVTGLSAYKARQAQLQYRKSVLIYQRNFAKKVIDYISSKTLAHTQTNIWGTLRVMQEVQAQRKTGISVVIISDMIPTSHVQYHCTGGVQIQSYEAAKNHAIKDSKRLRSTLQLDSNILRRVGSVQIHLLGDALSTSKAPIFLPLYWDTAFKQFQIDEILLKQ